MVRYTVAIALTLLLLFETGLATAASLETTVSQRSSVRDYTDQPVPYQQLLALLRSAYGYSGTNRVLPRIGDNYSLTLFSIDSSGTFLYNPETNSLSIWNATINKDTIRPRLTQSWENNATVVVAIVWNQTKMNNEHFAWAEAGLLVQNFYLAAVDLAIGTCCAQTFDSDGLRRDLNLPSTMIPLLIMPTGFPLSQYPDATPDYSRMTGNLPPVQNSQESFKDAQSSMYFTQAWSTQPLSLQEQSQLLWAAYGYASTGHRTTPSWGGWYPLIVYIANATGVFRYLPETHSVSGVQTGDKRAIIATACGNQVWATDAPAIFLTAYNSTVNSLYPEPGWYDLSVQTDAGCVAQQILLESSALNLSANIVAKGFESWNGTSAQSLRETLNIPSSIVPLYIIPVGHVVPTKSSSNISCQVSADSIKLSESLRVFGTISRTGASTGVIAGALVTLTYTKPDASTVNRTVISSATGTFLEIYTPDTLGVWSVKASWSGNSDIESATSGSITFTITTGGGLVSTTISCSVFPSSVTLNDSLTVSGLVSPAVSGATINLIYTKPDASTTTRIVTSKNDGSFTNTYTPDMAGNWSVKSSWPGDTSHKGSASTVAAFTVTEETQPPPTIEDGVPMEVVCAIALIIFVAVVAAVYFYMKRDKKLTSSPLQ